MRLATIAIVALGWSSSLATVADATENPRFVLIDLGTLGFTPNPDTHGTMGMSNLHHVVYGSDTGSGVRAWVWISNNSIDFGLSDGRHYLDNLSWDASFQSPNIARDMNTFGYIVGQSGGVESRLALTGSSGVATVWELSDSAPREVHTLGTIGSGSWSGAHALSEGANEPMIDSPVVVGMGGSIGDCENPPPDPPDNNDPLVNGFAVEYEGGKYSGAYAVL